MFNAGYRSDAAQKSWDRHLLKLLSKFTKMDKIIIICLITCILTWNSVLASSSNHSDDGKRTREISLSENVTSQEATDLTELPYIVVEPAQLINNHTQGNSTIHLKSMPMNLLNHSDDDTGKERLKRKQVDTTSLNSNRIAPNEPSTAGHTSLVREHCPSLSNTCPICLNETKSFVQDICNIPLVMKLLLLSSPQIDGGGRICGKFGMLSVFGKADQRQFRRLLRFSLADSCQCPLKSSQHYYLLSQYSTFLKEGQLFSKISLSSESLLILVDRFSEAEILKQLKECPRDPPSPIDEDEDILQPRIASSFDPMRRPPPPMGYRQYVPQLQGHFQTTPSRPYIATPARYVPPPPSYSQDDVQGGQSMYYSPDDETAQEYAQNLPYAPQQPPSYRPQPPVYSPKSPAYSPQPPVYRPLPSTYRPQPPTYGPQQPVYEPQPPVYRPELPAYSPEPLPYQPQPPLYRPPFSPSYVPVPYVPERPLAPQYPNQPPTSYDRPPAPYASPPPPPYPSPTPQSYFPPPYAPPTLQPYMLPSYAPPTPQPYMPPPYAPPTPQPYMPPPYEPPTPQPYLPPPYKSPTPQPYMPPLYKPPTPQLYTPPPYAPRTQQPYTPPPVNSYETKNATSYVSPVYRQQYSWSQSRHLLKSTIASFPSFEPVLTSCLFPQTCPRICESVYGKEDFNKAYCAADFAYVAAITFSDRSLMNRGDKDSYYKGGSCLKLPTKFVFDVSSNMNPRDLRLDLSLLLPSNCECFQDIKAPSLVLLLGSYGPQPSPPDTQLTKDFDLFLLPAPSTVVLPLCVSNPYPVPVQYSPSSPPTETYNAPQQSEALYPDAYKALVYTSAPIVVHAPELPESKGFYYNSPSVNTNIKPKAAVDCTPDLNNSCPQFYGDLEQWMVQRFCTAQFAIVAELNDADSLSRSYSFPVITLSISKINEVRRIVLQISAHSPKNCKRGTLKVIQKISLSDLNTSSNNIPFIVFSECPLPISSYGNGVKVLVFSSKAPDFLPDGTLKLKKGIYIIVHRSSAQVPICSSLYRETDSSQDYRNPLLYQTPLPPLYKITPPIYTSTPAYQSLPPAIYKPSYKTPSPRVYIPTPSPQSYTSASVYQMPPSPAYTSVPAYHTQTLPAYTPAPIYNTPPSPAYTPVPPVYTLAPPAYTPAPAYQTPPSPVYTPPAPPAYTPAPVYHISPPPVYTPAPSAYTPAPSAYTPVPPVYIPAYQTPPSVYTPSPPAYTPPVYRTLPPSAYSPAPPLYNPAPTYQTSPSPVYTLPPPAYTLAPVYRTSPPPAYPPTPLAYTPAPPVYTPAPPVYTPAPVYGTSSPPVYTPAPPAYTPAPPSYTPAPPAYTSAPPVYTPAPSYQRPPSPKMYSPLSNENPYTTPSYKILPHPSPPVPYSLSYIAKHPPPPMYEACPQATKTCPICAETLPQNFGDFYCMSQFASIVAIGLNYDALQREKEDPRILPFIPAAPPSLYWSYNGNQYTYNVTLKLDRREQRIRDKPSFGYGSLCYREKVRSLYNVSPLNETCEQFEELDLYVPASCDCGTFDPSPAFGILLSQKAPTHLNQPIQLTNQYAFFPLPEGKISLPVCTASIKIPMLYPSTLKSSTKYTVPNYNLQKIMPDCKAGSACSNSYLKPGTLIPIPCDANIAALVEILETSAGPYIAPTLDILKYSSYETYKQILSLHIKSNAENEHVTSYTGHDPYVTSYKSCKYARLRVILKLASYSSLAKDDIFTLTAPTYCDNSLFLKANGYAIFISHKPVLPNAVMPLEDTNVKLLPIGNTRIALCQSRTPANYNPSTYDLIQPPLPYLPITPPTLYNPFPKPAVTSVSTSPPINYNTPAPPISYKTPAPPSSYNTPAPPSSYNTPAPPASYNTRVPPVSYNTPPSPVAYNTPAPPASYNALPSPLPYNTPAPPENYNTPAPPAIYNTPAPPANYNRPVPPAKYNTPAPPANYNTPAPPTSYNTSPSPIAYNTPAPPANYNTLAPPTNYNTPAPPGSYNTPPSPVAYNTPAPPASYNTHAPPASYNTPAPPVRYNTPPPPVRYNTPPSPIAYNTPAPPASYNTPSSPASYNTPAPPASYNTHAPPARYNTPAPPASYNTPPSPIAYNTPPPPANYNTPVPPANYNTPAPPASYNTPPSPVAYDTLAPPASYNTPAPPASYNTPAPPVRYNTPPPPIAYNTPAPPASYNTPPSPVTYNTPPSPVTYNTPPSPVTYNTLPSPVTYNTPAPPIIYNTPTPTIYNTPVTTSYNTSTLVATTYKSITSVYKPLITDSTVPPTILYTTPLVPPLMPPPSNVPYWDAKNFSPPLVNFTPPNCNINNDNSCPTCFKTESAESYCNAKMTFLVKSVGMYMDDSSACVSGIVYSIYDVTFGKSAEEAMFSIVFTIPRSCSCPLLNGNGFALLFLKEHITDLKSPLNLHLNNQIELHPLIPGKLALPSCDAQGAMQPRTKDEPFQITLDPTNKNLTSLIHQDTNFKKCPTIHHSCPKCYSVEDDRLKELICSADEALLVSTVDKSNYSPGNIPKNERLIITQNMASVDISVEPYAHEDVCILPLKEGKCNGNLTRYYYDKSFNICEDFKFMGCDGNANNFESKEACERICLGKDYCREGNLEIVERIRTEEMFPDSNYVNYALPEYCECPQLYKGGLNYLLYNSSSVDLFDSVTQFTQDFHLIPLESHKQHKFLCETDEITMPWEDSEESDDNIKNNSKETSLFDYDAIDASKENLTSVLDRILDSKEKLNTDMYKNKDSTENLISNSDPSQMNLEVTTKKSGFWKYF